MEADYKKKIDDIHAALVGSELIKPGLIEKVDCHEKQLKNHDLYFGIVGGVFTIAAAVVAFWNDIKSIF